MKELLLALFVSTQLFAQTTKFTVEIENRNPDEIVISKKDFKHIIALENGRFRADLQVEKGIYQYFDGAEFAYIYLEPNFDFTLGANARNFHESLRFSGIGSNENNFLAQKWLSDARQKARFREKLPSKDELLKVLESRISAIKAKLSGGNFTRDFVEIMTAECEAETIRILEQFNEITERPTRTPE